MPLLFLFSLLYYSDADILDVGLASIFLHLVIFLSYFTALLCCTSTSSCTSQEITLPLLEDHPVWFRKVCMDFILLYSIASMRVPVSRGMVSPMVGSRVNT